jgi:hypothetical protein
VVARRGHEKARHGFPAGRSLTFSSLQAARL